MPPAAEFSIDDALAEFEVAQAEGAVEQQAILDSIRSESKAEANRRFLRQAKAEQRTLCRHGVRRRARAACGGQ